MSEHLYVTLACMQEYMIYCNLVFKVKTCMCFYWTMVRCDRMVFCVVLGLSSIVSSNYQFYCGRIFFTIEIFKLFSEMIQEYLLTEWQDWYFDFSLQFCSKQA